MAGWVMSARSVVMPGSGEMGWRSIETILTSFLGLRVSARCESELGGCDCPSVSEKTPSICCRNLASRSCHAGRPNFSPLMSTRESTWDQLPGAAQRSTTLVTPSKRLNSRINVSSVSESERVEVMNLHRAAEA